MSREKFIIIMTCIVLVAAIGIVFIMNPPYEAIVVRDGLNPTRTYMYNVYTGSVWLLENGEKVSGKSLAEIRELRPISEIIRDAPLPPPPTKPGLLEQYRKPE